MLDNAICWGIALALMFDGLQGVTDDYTKLLFAMGFILLGIISRAVSVYQDTHTIEIDEEIIEELKKTIESK